MGGATLAGILLGILRMKFAAVHLGPTGVGMIGLLQNFIMLAATVAGVGLGIVAPRQIASERRNGGHSAAGTMARTVLEASAVLGLLGMATIWVFRRQFAVLALGNPALVDLAGTLGVATLFTVVAAGQMGILTGAGRFDLAAKVTVWSNVASTALFVLSLFVLPAVAVPVLLISLPLASVIGCAAAFGKAGFGKMPRQRNVRGLFDTLSLGVTVTVTGVVTLAGQLAVRRLLSDDGGTTALGLFQAAWAVGSMYLMLALQAMGTDFFPRLSACENTDDRNRLVNEQTEIALTLGAPCILVLLGFAPVVLHFLYGANFVPAAAMLQWQMMGDVLKVASWPLGFALLARRRQASYFGCEALANLAFVSVTWAMIQRSGIAAPGIGYAAMYVVYLPSVFLAVHFDQPFRWSSAAKRDLAILIASACLVLAASVHYPALGMLLSAITGGFAAYRMKAVLILLRRMRSSSAGEF